MSSQKTNSRNEYHRDQVRFSYQNALDTLKIKGIACTFVPKMHLILGRIYQKDCSAHS